MAKNESRRVPPATFTEDETAFDALKGIPDYAPTNPDCSIASLTAAFAAHRAALEDERQAQAALDSARDITVSKAWEAHNLMLIAKDQVKSQYGVDSLEVQQLGLKRKSEYKAPGRKRGTPTEDS